MADPSTYRPAPGSIPRDPGVYRFRDEHGRVVYVGKARSLRSRLSSYFQDPAGLHPRTVAMLRAAASVEWTVVSTEVEALQLEYSWIKEFDPRFNVKYRDDKSYPYLAITMGEEVPRAQVMRGTKRRGTRYFGPYAHAWAIRETLDLLLRVFPVRTCSAGVYRRAAASGRPCLLGYIDKCSAPCIGRVTPDEHRHIAEELCDFLAGGARRHVSRLEREMAGAARELDFERAARLRDDIAAMSKALERSAVVLPDGTDADVIGIADDELEAAFHVFMVRDGRVRGQRGWVAEKQAESLEEVVAHLLTEMYGSADAEEIPSEILVPVLPEGVDQIGEWLRVRRGRRVAVKVPSRGDKRTLLATVTRNAEQSLARHKVARAGDLTSRTRALHELQEALGLEEAPLRIECFDISHVQGTNAVGSMVVFEDGLARKNAYRQFVIRGDAGVAEDGRVDDTAAMREVLTRRFRRYLEESATSVAGAPRDEDGRPARFAYPPNLVVVDGGPAQVAAAVTALDDLGVEDVAVVGLAKRLEEVWLPDEEFPVILPRASDGLYLLQRVRDEAHRFAVTFHRKRRSTSMTRSALDDIPGLGPTRQKRLLAHFGSLKRIRAATVDDIVAVPGIGPAVAAQIARALEATPAAPGVDAVTGEIREDDEHPRVGGPHPGERTAR
ncbi:excinuclease ABC subunit UvrC [Nostocoides sp. F2B08]|uniref:excinuclease ABC subunit UvrC n=1 Tax=Nostocoides sp. F2B08 TaxID=2653936 RepID=UPI00126392F8|nr:excinuclease ABC subunit UvrC [Tetrasphaera sp. F2B08]KAB7744546.1 excinuclease ABC subunit UvrC [Tetrasphaera sp. F2B08]